MNYWHISLQSDIYGVHENVMPFTTVSVFISFWESFITTHGGFVLCKYYHYSVLYMSYLLSHSVRSLYVSLRLHLFSVTVPALSGTTHLVPETNQTNKLSAHTHTYRILIAYKLSSNTHRLYTHINTPSSDTSILVHTMKHNYTIYHCLFF